MSMRQIEKTQIQNHSYERYVAYSKVLHRDFHFGFFRQSPPSQIRRTLYLFHGGGADDTQAVQAGLLPVLAELLQRQPETQIVMPSIGNSFLNNHPNLNYTKYFLEEVLPLCENETQTQAKSRFLGGWSMGGQAALNIFLRETGQFAGVGAHFPTLVDINYNDQNQVKAYMLRKNVTNAMAKVLVEEFQKVFVDTKDFNNHNPVALAKNIDKVSLTDKKIYFDVGSEDEFGLSEGAEALHKILNEKQVAHHFAVIPQGKHDGPFIHAHISKMLGYLL